MSEQTESLTKKRDSFISGVSVRGVVALMVAATVCTATLLKIEVSGLLQTIIVLVFGYYYGQRADSKP